MIESSSGEQEALVCGSARRTARRRLMEQPVGANNRPRGYLLGITETRTSLPIEPTGIRYFRNFLGKRIENIQLVFKTVRFRTVPVVSTWPWTRCPPRRWFSETARSRLTLLPTCNPPKLVLLNVSFTASKVRTFRFPPHDGQARSIDRNAVIDF